jgi:hypothetical protein
MIALDPRSLTTGLQRAPLIPAASSWAVVTYSAKSASGSSKSEAIHLPFHPSHSALRLSGLDRMELYYGIVPLRDDDLFSVERLLDQPGKMRLGFVDCHLLYAPKLANFMSFQGAMSGIFWRPFLRYIRKSESVVKTRQDG